MKEQQALRTVNLISGAGTTSLEVLKAQKPGNILHGLIETVAIITSNPNSNIQKEDIGFPEGQIHCINTEQRNWPQELLEILDRYQPDYFHQLGWMPKTPPEVLERHRGLNQHLGPGGGWMYGIRRIYAHQRFCEFIGEQRPIPVFIQQVSKEYDSGEIIHIQWEDLISGEKTEAALRRLFRIEYRVQVEGLRRLATNTFVIQSPPKLARTQEEERLLYKAMLEARDKYPRRNTEADLFHP